MDTASKWKSKRHILRERASYGDRPHEDCNVQTLVQFLLRRAAARAITAWPSRAVLAQPRSIATFSPSTLRTHKQHWPITFQKRFASDDASNTDAVQAAAGDASETEAVQTAAGDASESFAQTAAEAPLEDGLTPAQQDAQAAPTDAEATITPDALSEVERTAASAQARPGLNRENDTPPHNTLYVGNLYYEVTSEQLKTVFSRFGELESVRIVYDNRGLSRGFAYIEFKNVDDAQTAIDNLDMQVFEGRNLIVQYHRPSPRASLSPRTAPPAAPAPGVPSKTLFIGNMSFEMSDKDLNELFRNIRNVRDVRVAIDRRTGQPRGFAHADFIDVESATQAKQVLESKTIYGRQLRVDFSTSTNRPRSNTRADSGTQE
ncbi:hypothetical protein ACEQ8H_008824 [Pleosporales sp. CAS-2024a]